MTNASGSYDPMFDPSSNPDDQRDADALNNDSDERDDQRENFSQSGNRRNDDDSERGDQDDYQAADSSDPSQGIYKGQQQYVDTDDAVDLDHDAIFDNDLASDAQGYGI